MNAKNRIIAVLVLAVAVCSCYAQGGGQRRRGMGYGLAGLLGRADVQKDLGLSADQISKLEEARSAARGAGGRGGGGAPQDASARAAAQAERDKPFLAILTDDQKVRVHQIQIQLAGDGAAMMPDVQTALGLSDDQKSKIAALVAKQREADASIRTKVQSQEIDRATAREENQKNAQVLKDEIHKVLTEAQLAKLKDLGGKPFVADAPGGL